MRVVFGKEVAPVGHDLQELPSLYLLAGHPQLETLVDPALETVPTGQEVHHELSLRYWLAGH